MVRYNTYLLLPSAVLFVIFYILIVNYSNMNKKKLLSVEYEVYGRVQGVFFRKYTQQESKKLGLRGWCMNTEKGTVQGLMEGEDQKVQDMKHWLQNTGSPSSRIEKAEFRNEKEIEDYNYSSFSIKR